MDSSFEQIIKEELVALLGPIATVGDDPNKLQSFVTSLGWNLDALTGLDINAVGRIASAIHDAVQDLLSKKSGGIMEATSKIIGTRAEIARLAELLTNWSVPQTLPAETGIRFLEDLSHSLLFTYLSRKHPTLKGILVFLGIIELKAGAAITSGKKMVRRETLDARLRFDKIADALQNPLGNIENMSRDGTGKLVLAEALADTLLPLAADLLNDMGIEATCGGLTVKAASSQTQEQIDATQRLLVVNCWIPTVSDQEEALSLQRLIVGLAMASDGSGPALLLGTSDAIKFAYGGSSARASLSVNHLPRAILLGRNGIETLGAADSTPPSILLQFTMPGAQTGEKAFFIGSATAPLLSVETVEASLSLAIQSVPDLTGQFAVRGLRFRIQGDGRDSFISQNLPIQNSALLEADLSFKVSLRHGLQFNAGLGAEQTFEQYLHVEGVRFGPFTVRAQLRTDRLALEASTNIELRLGPVCGVVQDVGVQFSAKASEGAGEFGPFSINFGLSGPKGISLSIKAQVVTGGGYLYFDPVKEQYAGVLQLEIAGKFSLSAVGLLTTKMPDGSKGFSLLVIISVRFDPGIQLGYGFSLNGLGGLLGVNRTAMAEVLREGLRRGALGSVLFPQNIVENAPKIVSNLSTIFTPAQDRFLFGPMAIIGWGGAPPILTMEIGIILELPEPVRLMILGRLRVTLPPKKEDSTQIEGASSGDQDNKQDTPKIKLQLDSLGIINFGTGDISLDAYLYDSTIGPFTITGGMALRASFGANPLFLLSVGGFHPAFQAPAGFPSIERVALGLYKKESGLEVRLQLAAYFALTSNTVQFGAHLDLYVHVWEFEIVGLLGFDALIQFQPFGLIASFEAMVSVKAFGQTLMAVGLQVNATGPSPWHVWGKAQFTLLFFSGTAEFDALIGHEETPFLPPPIDVEQELFAELQKLSNWSSQLAEGEHPLVTFRDSALPKDPAGTSPKKKLFIHPLAELHVNQRLVPLNTDPITRYGTTTPTGATTFALEAKVDGEAVAASLLNAPPLSDWFARAQFYVMSDAEKLAAPSFEEKNSGIRVQAAEGYISGTPVGSVMKAAQTGKDGIQSNLEAAKFLDRVAHLGAAGQAPIRAAGPAKYGDPSWWDQGITLRKAGYRVVGEEDDGAAPKMRATRRGEASSPSSLFEEAKAAVAEPVMSYSAARARATRARQRAPKRRTWVVPDIGMKRGDR
jgi:hypothetical protein